MEKKLEEGWVQLLIRRWAFPGACLGANWELCFPRRMAGTAMAILIAEDVGGPNLPSWVQPPLAVQVKGGCVQEAGLGEMKEDGNLLTCHHQ